MIEILSANRYFIYLSLLYSALIVYVAIKARRARVSVNVALDISVIIMVIGFIGARLAHAYWEAPFYYKNNLIEVLKFWNGGFIFYGGAIAALIGATIYISVVKEDFWTWADFFTPVASIGYALGRVSCLISGCCYGRSCDLYFPFTSRHPTQLYASVLELLNFFLILKFQKRIMRYRSGLLFLVWAVFHAAGRIVMEYFREDFRGPEILRMSFGTFLSVIIILVAIGLIYVRTTSNKIHGR